MKVGYTSNLRNTFNRFSPVRFAGVALAVLALLFLVPAAHAQITGTITGTVYDNSGAVVPGALVTLMNQMSRDVRTTSSDTAGYFAFPSVVVGTYNVKIEAKGFKAFQQTDIVLQAADKRNINATLAVGQTTEVVTVEARTDIIPVDSPAHTLDLTSTDYNRLPMITRNAVELLRELPGAVTVGNGTSNGSGSNMDFSGTGAAGSSVGNGVSISGVPYRGGTALLMDGTNILDEGCDCTSISVPNPDMVQEVKVQTSAFGADSAKGPVVIDFLTKSGGAQYHGEGYLYTRNAIFNSDSWTLNHQGKNVATGDHYYYPGGNFGGPIPGTNKKLQFWFGYEHFYQLATGGTTLTSYIPTADMLAGNFGQTAANTALCNADFPAMKTKYGNAADITDSTVAGTYCYDPSTGKGPGGASITAAAVPVDPGAAKLWTLMPKANADPTTTPGGYNYFYAVPALHNGYVYRGRGDYNFNDNNKLFVTYQYSSDSQPSDGDSHMWWLPSNSVVFPGGGLTNLTQTKNITGNFLHVFSPTLTNQMTGFWTYYNSPQSPGNFNAVLRGTVGYPANYGTIFAKTKPLPQTMVPGWNQAGNYTFPDFSQWDVFSGTGGSYYIRKENPAFSDDLTKVYKAHTLKVGFYWETTGNNQANFNPINGGFSFGSSSTPYPDGVTGLPQGTQNPTANFMMGIASNYNEQSSLPLNDQAYKTFAFYGMDSWKVTRRFTADFGVRLEHIGHWYDRDGYGNAVWVPGDLVSDVLKGKVFPGIEWHAIDPGIPLSGTPDRFAHFEPRAGIAYDLFGDGKTVIRGGWGVYMFGDQVNDYGPALALAQQSIGTNLPSNTTVLFSETGLLPKPAQVFSPPSSGSTKVLDPNDYDVSWTQNWNFTIDQRLPWNTHFSLAYEGNNSGALNLGGQVENGTSLGGASLLDVNKVPLGAFFNPDPITGQTATDPENVCGAAGQCTSAGLADYHPYGMVNIGTSAKPDYVNVYGTNQVSVNEHKGYANYNALEAVWAKQAGRFTFNTSFLWSKALGFSTGSINPYVLRANYVVLAIDRPFVWNTSYTFDLGKAYHGDNKLVGGAANGWTISGFTTWQKGPDLQAQLGDTGANLFMGFQYSYLDPVTGKTVTSQLTQRSFYGTDASMNVQPIETCNPTSGIANNQTAKLSCFAPPDVPSGTPAVPDLGLAATPYTVAKFGPTQLPYISLPAFFDSDLALYKTFHITERHTIEFRLTATNFLNHALLGFSNNNPLTLKYSLDPSNKGAGYTYIGTTPASNWGFADIKNEPGTNSYGRVLQWGIKYSF
jgi:hypothetical protein